MTLAVRRAGSLPRLLALAVTLVFASCSRDLMLGSDLTAPVAAAGTTSVAGTAGIGTAGAGAGSCEPATCYGRTYKCGNCRDDDGDGLIDSEDPECTGPCDDAEDSLSVALPGGNSASCQKDCYFDRGGGSGNDQCRYSERCDPLSVPPDYNPSGESSCSYDENARVPGSNSTCSELAVTQPATCAEICGPLTPNGCDCFGCCELPANSGTYIWLETSKPCTPVKACKNDCDPCEVCVGRPKPLFSCESGTPACPSDYRTCIEPGDGACPVGSYCVTGCCIPEPR